MAGHTPRRLATVVGRVIALGPPAFRDRYRLEIVDTLTAALESERRRQGGLAMASLWLRIWTRCGPFGASDGSLRHVAADRSSTGRETSGTSFAAGGVGRGCF